MKNSTKILILFFIIAVFLRLGFAFQTNTFTGDEAYFELRQIDSIVETGRPIINDELSYGGRTQFELPVFNYIVAIFSVLMSASVAAKIIPNILAALIIFPVYFLSMHITKNEKAALIASFISMFIPVYSMATLNSISPNSIFLPAFFYMLYCFLHIMEDEKYINYFIVLLFLTTFIEPLVVILIPVFALYYLLSRAEGKRIEVEYLEIMLFTLIVVVWADFIIFKKAFLVNGALIIRENIPSFIMNQHFGAVSLLSAISLIGILPLILGLFVIYQNTFEYEKKSIFLITSLALVIFILLLTRFIRLDVGLIFLGITLTILSSQFFARFFEYMKGAKFSKYNKLFWTVLITLLILTSVIPTLVVMNQSIKDSVSESEIETMEWLKENTEEGSTVLGTLEQGHLITSIAERKNVMDSNFMLIKDPEKRIRDVERIYTELSKTNAIRLLYKYQVNYIIISEDTRLRYGIEDLAYSSEDCFEKTELGEVTIYKSKCQVNE